MYLHNRLDISELVGKTFVKVEQKNRGGHYENEGILFHQEDGSYYVMTHEQDCCEHVYLEDMEGELSYLENTPILVAEEVNGETPDFPENEYEPESYTWTFYKIASIKGHVDFRWFGSSNGYYSESVDLYFVDVREAEKSN